MVEGITRTGETVERQDPGAFASAMETVINNLSFEFMSALLIRSRVPGDRSRIIYDEETKRFMWFGISIAVVNPEDGRVVSVLSTPENLPTDDVYELVRIVATYLKERFQISTPDQAMAATATEDVVVAREEVGGIDLNPALLDMQIKRDGKGVPLPVSRQNIDEMQIEGVLPVIINVTPIPNLPFLFSESFGQQPPPQTLSALPNDA